MSQEIIMFDRWLELPSDLLHEIAKHIHSSKDYARFRAVCKSWNMDIPKTPNHIRGPWLVLPFNDDETLNIEEKDFYLRLPKMRNIMLRGSYFGWLISVGIDGVLRMLNPFTSVHFDLPPMSTIPDIVDYRLDMEGIEYLVRSFSFHHDGSNYEWDKVRVQKIHLQKIIISSSPNNEKQDFMAITIYGEYDRLAFCKFADTEWTEFSTPGIISCGLEDAIFFEGKIYAINWNAQLFEFDVKTSMGSISEVPKPDDLYILSYNMSIKYLIRGVEGNLLMVVRHLKNVRTCYKTDTFDIYKLDQSAKQWTRMFSLGNYVIVVGFNSSVCVLPFSDGKGNWVRNCIYFSDNNVEAHYNQIVGGHDAGVFNLEDGRVHELFPNSEFLYPPPIWLFSQNFMS